MVSSDRSTPHLLVCQNRTCRKQSSAKILAAFQEFSLVGGTGETPVLRVEGSGCLGRCGNGPMVLVLPDEVWYCRVSVDEVPLIVARHLLGGFLVED